MTSTKKASKNLIQKSIYQAISNLKQGFVIALLLYN